MGNYLKTSISNTRDINIVNNTYVNGGVIESITHLSKLFTSDIIKYGPVILRTI